MKKVGLIFVVLPPKRPILTSSQLDKLADVLIAAGQLSAGSIILPFIIPGFDKTKIPMIILGAVMTFSSWILSILIVRRVK